MKQQDLKLSRDHELLPSSHLGEGANQVGAEWLSLCPGSLKHMRAPLSSEGCQGSVPQSLCLEQGMRSPRGTQAG